jgi:lysozyme
MHILGRIVFTVAAVTVMTVSELAAVMFSEAVVTEKKYPVMGVDVSHYQGIIDWNLLEEQNVSFAFIKATEGSGHIDESAAENLEKAAETSIMISAYHFFSFDSAGETQAENYISVVGADDINMPPVVDIEYYGDKSSNKPTYEETVEILAPLLERLEEYYGTKPIIYTTLPVYMRYIGDEFSDYPLWIRNVYCEPTVLDWKFWQYSDKGELYGFNGEEKYIDLNVYNGSEEDFLREFGGK